MMHRARDCPVLHQATVPADKEMSLGMVRESIGIDHMNTRVRALFRELLPDISQYFISILQDRANK